MKPGEDVLMAALRFLYERCLSKADFQAEITVIKKEPSKQDKGGAA